MKASFSRVGSRRSGLSAIEAALVLPIFFLLLFGLLEYGWMFLKSQQLNNAARNGVREGIVHGSTAADVTTRIDQLMLEADLQDSGYSVVLTPNDPTTLAPGELLTVTITVDYSSVELIGVPLIPVPTTIGGTTSMAREGPVF